MQTEMGPLVATASCRALSESFVMLTYPVQSDPTQDALYWQFSFCTEENTGAAASSTKGTTQGASSYYYAQFNTL